MNALTITRRRREVDRRETSHAHNLTKIEYYEESNEVFFKAQLKTFQAFTAGNEYNRDAQIFPNQQGGVETL